MDDRLRQFSPPPWAALGRRDPNREQAPWRESENVEDRRNPGWSEWLEAKGRQIQEVPGEIIRGVSALGARPASNELMQRYFDDISASLPREKLPTFGQNRIPMHYATAARADGGVVEEAPWRSSQPDARMALYEAELKALERAGVPTPSGHLINHSCEGWTEDKHSPANALSLPLQIA
jgi:hypothetical protein